MNRARKPDDSASALDKKALRIAAEAAWQPEPLRTNLPDDAALHHELQVHQIELQMQNDSLREAQTALEEARDHYVDLYEFAPVGYLTLSRQGYIVDINLTGAGLLAQDRAQLCKRRFSNWIAAKSRDQWYQHFLKTLNRPGRNTIEIQCLQHGEIEFWAELDCVAKQGMDGNSVMRVTLTDISERRLAQEELRIAAIVFQSHEGTVVTDANAQILRVNNAFCRLTGYTPEEVIGRNPSLLQSGRHDSSFYTQMWRQLAEHRYWQGEVWNRTKTGEAYAERLTISALANDHGSITHYVGTFSDITKALESEAEIERLGHYDPLTGLPNRRLLYDRINQNLIRLQRTTSHSGLLFLDLDNFKNLNDTRGHGVGDELLIETAKRIHACIRESDTVARLGGDEFVVLLYDLPIGTTDAAVQATRIAQEIRVAIAAPWAYDGQDLRCTASIGVVLIDQQLHSVETLIKRADMAMYEAKHLGRNTIRFFDPTMQTALDERVTLDAELRKAIVGEELRVHFQPQVDAHRCVIGAEALVRWAHPRLGLVQPLQFIALAEETGQISALGDWVLRHVCAQLRIWAEIPALANIDVAVNVSVHQFRQPDFVDRVREILETTGAKPRRLKLELTESVVVDEVPETIARMQELKDLGMRFSMDDFGTGFSSLTYLKRLPLDQIKIDRAFVSDLAMNTSDAAIVQTIITMGKTLGLDVIAEGVETEAQLACLAHFGCLSYQGYLFSRPLPTAEFEAFVMA